MRNFFSRKSNPAKELDKDPQITGSSNINSDILLNEKLKESEIRYRRLFESAKDGILILNFETGEIVDANPFIVKIIDYPLEKILGKKLWEIGLFSNKEESELAFIELKTNSYIRFEDMPIQRRNGKITEVEFISNVYLESNTKVIQCNIRDITERKTTEKALIESEAKFRSIMENSADPIFIADQKGKYLYTNKAITDMLGYSAEEMQRKTFIDLIPKNEVDKYFEYFKVVVDKGKLFTEIELLKKDGSYVTTDLNSVLLPGGLVYGSCRDISNRKQAELALKESEQNLKNQNADFFNLNKEYADLNEELIESLRHLQKINDELVIAKVRAEESDKLKSAFLANMSHEIRTPMNAIMGFSEFLLQPGISKEKLENFVQIINVSSLQLMSVISDVIDISKIETGQITIDSALVNINNLLDELFITYKKIVQRKNLCFDYSCDSPNDIIEVNTDGNRIKQVLCNLLNNAIKFTQEGKIEFGYKLKKNFIEFYVKDTGIGIAPENHALIFQRFRQVEITNMKAYGGNGLGLSISKALVEKLGGSISIDSELGAGSTFIFTIPYIKEIETNVSPLITTESNHYTNWNGKTVLIVEDEVHNHTYIEELLSDTNIRMLHAWDGRDAVEQVKKHADISLVLMDIKMPIMDGYEATRLIKQIRPKLPVIAQTAYALSSDREQALKAGCDDYISKPIQTEALLDLIINYLD